MNRHKYLGYESPMDKTLKHIIGGPLTGVVFSDTVRQVSCPKCESQPGYHCETPKGRKAWPPHVERIIRMDRG